MIKIQSLIIYSSCVVLGSVIFTEASAANLRIIGYGKVCCLFVYIGHSYILTHWLTGLLLILINPSIHSHPTVHTDIQLVGGLFRFKQVTGQRVIQPLNVECTGHSSMLAPSICAVLIMANANRTKTILIAIVNIERLCWIDRIKKKICYCIDVLGFYHLFIHRFYTID